MAGVCGKENAVVCSGDDAFEAVGLEPQSFTGLILALWHRDIDTTPLSKDLPRLCRRTTIYTNDGREHTFDHRNEDGEFHHSIAQSIRDIMITLVEDTEGSEQAQLKAQEIDEVIAGHDDNSDFQLLLPLVFEIVGKDSPAMRLLRYCHQNVVLCCMQHLKDPTTGIMANLMTKDIRTPEGWRFTISLADQTQVWHRRREQSVDLWNNTDDHFEVEWEVRITFVKERWEPSAASLRITKLETAETMSEDMETELRNTIVGDLIVA